MSPPHFGENYHGNVCETTALPSWGRMILLLNIGNVRKTSDPSRGQEPPLFFCPHPRPAFGHGHILDMATISLFPPYLPPILTDTYYFQ
jgi:hypothetical protein